MRKELNCVGGIINRVLGIKRTGGTHRSNFYWRTTHRGIWLATRVYSAWSWRSATMIHENSEWMKEGQECHSSGLCLLCKHYLLIYHFLLFSMVRQYLVSQGLLHCRSFTITLKPHSVGLLWTSDRPIADFWQHNAHNEQTSMPPAEFEPAFPESELQQTHALYHMATGMGSQFDDSDLSLVLIQRKGRTARWTVHANGR